MYEEAEAELRRILQLVDVCPEPLRARAFEILLKGYVTSLTSAAHPPAARHTQDTPPPPPPPPGDQSWKEGIPEDVLPRFQTTASRIKVTPQQLADVFDFSTDPFTFAAIHIDGRSRRERLYRVAMLVAARTYLATGKWAADWAEIKAMSTHQNCYDVNNFAHALRHAEGDWFKKVTTGENVQLSAKGQKEAERLLRVIAGGENAPEE